MKGNSGRKKRKEFLLGLRSENGEGGVFLNASALLPAQWGRLTHHIFFFPALTQPRSGTSCSMTYQVTIAIFKNVFLILTTSTWLASLRSL